MLTTIAVVESLHMLTNVVKMIIHIIKCVSYAICIYYICAKSCIICTQTYYEVLPEILK